MTRWMTRMLAMVVVAAMALAMLAACGGDDDGGNADVEFSEEVSGTLNAWGFENADDVGTSRLTYAESQLSGVQIELDATAFDAQKFTTRIASGDVPDVVQMDRRFVPTYAAQGLLVPLDECFSTWDVDAEERWYEAVAADVRFDDTYWGVPQFYQPPAIILNKDVMDAAGVTNEDIDTSDPDKLLAAIEKMYQESGGNPSVIGFDPVGTGQTGLWIQGNGGQLVDDEGKPTLDNEDNIAGIELLKRIYDAQGGFAKVKSFTDSFDVFGENNQFVADQVGAQVNPQWYPNVLSPYVDDINIEAVPFRGSDGEPFSVTGGQAFVIPAGAENPNAACAWMLNLTSQDAWLAAGAARAETRAADGGINTGLFTGSPEADRAIREQYIVESGNAGFDQVIETYYEVVDYGQSYAVSPAGQEIVTELVSAVTAALLGEKTPEQALEDAQDAAMRAYDQIMANNDSE